MEETRNKTEMQKTKVFNVLVTIVDWQMKPLMRRKISRSLK